MNPFTEAKKAGGGGNPFTAAKQAGQGSQVEYRSGIFPLTRYDDGSVRFDIDSGITGAVKRAVTLPGEVMRGEVNPTSDEGMARAFEMGAVVSPMTPSMRNTASGAGIFSNKYKAKPKVPTAEELKAAAKPVYEQLNRAGTEFSAKSVDDLSTAIQNELIQKRFVGPEDAPKTFRKLSRLQNAQEGATVPFATGINAARKQLGQQGAKPDLVNSSDPGAASYAARRIMDWFEGGADNGVVAGPSIPTDLLKAANRNYAAAKRSETLTGLRGNAELQAAAANSGKNLGNTTRQRIAGLLINKGSAKDRSGFTRAELNALEKNVVEGTVAANATRDLGNTLGGGGGLGGLIASGMGGGVGAATTGTPMGAAVGAAIPALVGRGSKAVSNALTKRALSQVDKSTRMRSALYEELLAAAPTKTMALDTRQAIVKALLAQMMREGQYSAPSDADLMLR